MYDAELDPFVIKDTIRTTGENLKGVRQLDDRNKSMSISRFWPLCCGYIEKYFFCWDYKLKYFRIVKHHVSNLLWKGLKEKCFLIIVVFL